MRKKKIWENWRLLNPKNLQKEVDAYGYHFSWKSHAALLFGALAGIGAVGMLFQLQRLYFAAVVLAVVVALPVLVLDMYKGMYEQRRFADVTAYMEQMLYAFQKSGKVVGALRECREIFPDGQMNRLIGQAVTHMEQGVPDSEVGVLRESLELIERQYACEKISMVHRLLASAEEHGGEVSDGVLFALEDIESWKKRGYRLHAEKKKCHADNVVSIVVAVILCAAALAVLDGMRGMFAVETEVSVFRIPVIQVSSVLFILALLWVFAKSTRSLTDDWLQCGSAAEESYLLDCYEKVRQGPGERSRGFKIAGTVLCVLILLAVLCRFKVVVIVCAALLLFLLTEKRIGLQIAKKDVTRQLYLSIPQWLMELALLLQTNNVQVAIARSSQEAGAVLREELDGLIRRMEKAPERLDTYTDFCSSFDIPEAASCMKMLHAFSESGSGNMQVQIGRLVERVGQMQDVAGEIQNESVAFRMKLIFSYPVMAATVKLLVDLSVGMAVMMQFLGSMGGM